MIQCGFHKHIFSFIGALFLGWCTVPVAIRIAKSLRILDVPDGGIKSHSAPVPYLGGVAVYVASMIMLAIVYPFEPHLFVFCNRRRDKIKILYFEDNGFVLWYKRLEKSHFYWPCDADTDVVTLSGQELNWLLDGYDVSQLKPHRKLSYTTVL